MELHSHPTALRVKLLLNTELSEHHGLILVCSSMGGYVSTVASRIAAVHGWHDEVVPVDNTIHWAKHYQTKLVLVDDDHSLLKEVATVGELLVKMIAQVTSNSFV